MMTQIYLFKKQVWRNFQRQIIKSRQIILFIDYDGTIVPIKKQPHLAVLSLNTRAIIELLVNKTDIFVGIITGRSLTDIRNLVRIRNMLYAADHGFQIYHKKRTWIHPEGKRVFPLLIKLEKALKKALIPIDGIFIENKGLTLSVHYRNVRAGDVFFLRTTIKQIVQPYREFIRITNGKKVIEIRPDILWDKGYAILRILKLLRAPAKSVIIFIGDDKTDEDAFKLLPPHVITIRVRKNKSSCAKYCVRHPSEVKQLLENIYLLKRKSRDYK